MLALLNTSILTSYGTYSYRWASLAEAQKMVLNENGFLSCIGHQSTAKIMSKLLGVYVPVNRYQYEQIPGDTALVFKLNGRPEEGRILSVADIEEIGYEWGILERIS